MKIENLEFKLRLLTEVTEAIKEASESDVVNPLSELKELLIAKQSYELWKEKVRN